MTAYAELGSVLRAARLKASRTLADVAVDTGLPERYLQALEAGDMKVLPDLSYARLYCQSYARALHLDVDEVMKSWPAARRAEPVPPQPTTSNTWWRWPLLAVAAASLIWLLVQTAFRDASPSGPPPAAESPRSPQSGQLLAETYDSFPQMSPPDSFADSLADSFADTFADTLADTATPAAVTPRRMTLQVTTAEQSWVVIEADGDTVKADVLLQGESLSAEAFEEFQLTVTNPRGLQVWLDGEAVLLEARVDRPLIRHPIRGKESP